MFEASSLPPLSSILPPPPPSPNWLLQPQNMLPSVEPPSDEVPFFERLLRKIYGKEQNLKKSGQGVSHDDIDTNPCTGTRTRQSPRFTGDIESNDTYVPRVPPRVFRRVPVFTRSPDVVPQFEETRRVDKIEANAARYSRKPEPDPRGFKERPRSGDHNTTVTSISPKQSDPRLARSAPQLNDPNADAERHSRKLNPILCHLREARRQGKLEAVTRRHHTGRDPVPHAFEVAGNNDVREVNTLGASLAQLTPPFVDSYHRSGGPELDLGGLQPRKTAPRMSEDAYWPTNSVANATNYCKKVVPCTYAEAHRPAKFEVTVGRHPRKPAPCAATRTYQPIHREVITCEDRMRARSCADSMGCTPRYPNVNRRSLPDIPYPTFHFDTTLTPWGLPKGPVDSIVEKNFYLFGIYDDDPMGDRPLKVGHGPRPLPTPNFNTSRQIPRNPPTPRFYDDGKHSESLTVHRSEKKKGVQGLEIMCPAPKKPIRIDLMSMYDIVG